jgi:hypothetical protein
MYYGLSKNPLEATGSVLHIECQVTSNVRRINLVDTRVLKLISKTSNELMQYFRETNIGVYFFLNNQPDALIIPILFCYKTLHVSGIFSAHHQEFFNVHSALCSILTLLGSGHQKPALNLPVPNVY